MPQASAQTTCELQDKGYWRHNPNAWPVTSLMLGTNTYNQQQLLTILGMPVSGDASVIVAQQLIPTLLNIANGTNENPVSATIEDANAVIGSKTIPAKIKPNTADGRQMTSDAKILESYNQGLLTQPCGCTEGAPGCGWTNGEMHTGTQTAYGTLGSIEAGVLGTSFSTVLGGLVTIGGTFTISFTNVPAILSYLPAAGPPGPLTGSLLNPQTSSSGELGGQVLALQLNADLSAAYNNAVDFGALRFCNFTDVPSLNGQTVDQFLAVANHVLGGGAASLSLPTIVSVARDLNEAFVNGVPSPFAQESLRVGGCGWENGEMTTFTQTTWGDAGSSAGTLLGSNFQGLYGSSLVIGGNATITFTNAGAVFTFLPAIGTAAALTGSLLDPQSSSAGELAGEVLALQLNADFSDMVSNSVSLEDLKICNFGLLPVLNGQTVGQFRATANHVLGGGNAPFGPTETASVARSINNAFVNGVPSTFAQSNLFPGACP